MVTDGIDSPPSLTRGVQPDIPCVSCFDIKTYEPYSAALGIAGDRLNGRVRIRLTATYLLISLFLLGSGTIGADAKPLAITDDGRTAGYVTLSWADTSTTDTQENFVVELFRNDDPFLSLETRDLASSFTGLPDGAYTVKVLRSDGSMVGDIAFEVSHHPLGRALIFFATGAVVFAVLLYFLSHARTEEDT